jgi:glutathionyl-hydroquinone reductase
LPTRNASCSQCIAEQLPKPLQTAFDPANGFGRPLADGEIIRTLNSTFDEVGAAAGDYCPSRLLPEIDAVNQRTYETIKHHYYGSHRNINPSGIVPLGSCLGLGSPSGR